MYSLKSYAMIPDRRSRISAVPNMLIVWARCMNTSDGLRGPLLSISSAPGTLAAHLPKASNFLIAIPSSGSTFFFDVFNRRHGFAWKGLNIKVCSSDETECFRRELLTIRNRTSELAQLSHSESETNTLIPVQNTLIPLLSLAKYGAEHLAIGAGIIPDPEWKRNKSGYFQRHFPGKAETKEIVPLDCDVYDFSGDRQPRMVMLGTSGNNSKENYTQPTMVYVPANSEVQIEVFPNINAAEFEERLIMSMLETGKGQAATLATNRIDLLGWNIQICHVKNKGKENERVNAIRSEMEEEKIKGDAVLGCYYYRKGSENVPEKVDEIVMELRAKSGVNINVRSLKCLLHQKGLGMRYVWLLLPFIKERTSQQLLRINLLLRAIKKLILAKLAPKKSQNYRQTLLHYLNCIFHHNSSPADSSAEILRTLFFSRLRIMKEAHSVLGSGKALSFLYGDKIVQSVLRSGRHSPALLLASAEFLFGARFSKETLRSARADRHAFLKVSPPLDAASIAGVEVNIEGPGWIEDAYYEAFERIVKEKIRTSNVAGVASEKKESYLKVTKEQRLMSTPAQEQAGQNGEANNEEQKTIRKEIKNRTVNFSDARGSLFLLRDIIMPAKYDSSSIDDKSSPLEISTTYQGRLALEKWAEYSSTLFSNLRSVTGTEHLLLYSRLLSHLPHLNFPESTHLSAILELIEDLKSLHACPPETILFSLTMSGLVYTCMGLHAESECFLTYALWVFLMIYGDPRGRGNSSHPWGLLLTHLLKRLAEISKRASDVDYMDEVFSCIRHNLEESEGVLELDDVKISIEIGEDSQKSAQHGIQSEIFPGKQQVIDIFLKGTSLIQANGSLSAGLIQWIMVHNPVRNSAGTVWRHEEIMAAFNAKLGTLYPKLESMSRSVVGATPGKERRQLLLSQGNSFCQLFTKECGAVTRADSKGAVFVWGADQYGQLGLAENEQEFPSENKKLVYPRFCYALKDRVIRDVACGRNNSFAIDIHNAVYAWGANEYGQLGLGRGAPRNVSNPSLIRGLPADLSIITSGIEHTAGYCASGEVFTWGNGESGLLGHGDGKSYDTPKKVVALADKAIKMVVCGGLHTVALSFDGRIFAWGRAEGGQLGLSEHDLEELMRSQGDCYVSVPRLIDTGPLRTTHMDSLACGEAHTLALDNTGAVYGWGFSNYGQLGLGKTSDCYEPGTGDFNSKVNIPTKVEALNGVKIVKLTAGSTFSLFVSDSGEVYGCGVNDFGQTGTEVCQRDLEICITLLLISIHSVSGAEEIRANYRRSLSSSYRLLC